MRKFFYIILGFIISGFLLNYIDKLTGLSLTSPDEHLRWAFQLIGTDTTYGVNPFSIILLLPIVTVTFIITFTIFAIPIGLILEKYSRPWSYGAKGLVIGLLINLGLIESMSIKDSPNSDNVITFFITLILFTIPFIVISTIYGGLKKYFLARKT